MTDRDVARDAALALRCARIEAGRLCRARAFLVLGVLVPMAFLAAGIVRSWSDGDSTALRVGLVTAAIAAGAGAGATAGGGRLAADRATGWLWRIALTPMPRRAYLAGRASAALALAALAIVVAHLAAAVVSPAVRDPAVVLPSLAATVTAAPLCVFVGLLVGLVARSRRSGRVLALVAYAALVVAGALGAVAGVLGLDPGVIATMSVMVPVFSAGLLATAAPGSLSSPLLLAAVAALVLQVVLSGWAVVVVGRRTLRPARQAGRARQRGRIGR